MTIKFYGNKLVEQEHTVHSRCNAVALDEWSMLSRSSCGSVLGVIGPTLEDPQQTDAESQTLSQRESLSAHTDES